MKKTAINAILLALLGLVLACAPRLSSTSAQPGLSQKASIPSETTGVRMRNEQMIIQFINPLDFEIGILFVILLSSFGFLLGLNSKILCEMGKNFFGSSLSRLGG